MKAAITSDNLAILASSMIHANTAHCHLHHHSYMEIIYQTGGTGITRLKNKDKLRIINDSLIIYWPQVRHEQYMDKIGTDACILLDISNIDWLPKDRMWLNANLENNNYLKREILSLATLPPKKNTIQQKSANLRSTALLLDLVDLALKQESAGESVKKIPPYVIKAHDYIHNNLGTSISLTLLASELDISHDHLRHEFKKAYGNSMVQHLCKIRIERAQQYLIYSHLPLKQIASECGFNNTRYFNTCFKKHTRLTPGEYRQKHAEVI